ncbi:replicative DNA helicase [Ruficoccus amylovorans]|uniref:Replicative DNA helicase n=1 Tax=Ruficoccus amylovorans TaxID=1804625 RepID=A0A842HKI0_9BACT|nr:replicative DNA helicase [Ruficoccus amylovorans]MBC2596184.1 replicative DNA helicase [Ruficoccus amylovorans]
MPKAAAFKSSSDEPRRRKESPAASRRVPYSIDMEQALLGAIILEGGAETMAICVQERVRPECFYNVRHQLIYKAMFGLYEKQDPIDEITLSDRLRKDGNFEDAGGDAYLVELSNRIDTHAHLPYYIQRVRDTYLLREVIRLSNEAIEGAYDETQDVDSFLEKTEQNIFSISETRIVDSAQPLEKSIDDAVQLVNNMIQNKGEITGVTTGFADLDKMTTGWHEGEMIVVAARPSMGKTSIALNMIEPAICGRPGREPVGALMFSLEMPSEQLAMRLLCSRARVNMTKLRDGFVPKEKQQDIVRAAQELKNSPLMIDDSSGLNILELRAKARRVASQMKGKLGLIAVDYIQLVAGTDSRIPREQQIAEISRGMKGMAKELRVPVIVLAQLNREAEKEKRQPRISDLRESGSIEQDADVVLLLSKPRDYNEEEDMAAEAVARDLIVAKQRNGPIGTVPLYFIKHLTRFENSQRHSA